MTESKSNPSSKKGKTCCKYKGECFKENAKESVPERLTKAEFLWKEKMQ